MSDAFDRRPRLWLTDLVQTDPSAERLARLVGLGRVDGAIVSRRLIPRDLTLIRPLTQAGWDVDRTSDALLASDVRLASGLLLPLHECSNGKSGFVAALLPPGMEAATARRRAGEIVRQVNRPNVVIGYACDAEGLQAARAALASGEHTLVFAVVSLESLGQCLDACTDGLLGGQESKAMLGPPQCLVVFDPAPVASRVEALLAKQGPQAGRRLERATALAGRTRNVLLQLALAQVGAAQAHLGERGTVGLVAMTTCSEIGLDADPALPAPETPIGVRLGDAQEPAEEMIRLGLSSDWAMLSSARAHLEALAALGISVDIIGAEEAARVLDEAKTADGQERRRTEAMMRPTTAELGDLAGDLPAVLTRLDEDDVAARLWRGDISLWTDVPAEAEEAARRLGWLALPERMQSRVDELRAFAEEVRREGLRHAVVLGMGGSSLAPDVFRRMLSPVGGMPLHVLDSTDPEMVDQVARDAPPHESLYLVSSKSGTTTEPLALLEYFWAASAIQGDPGRHFVAITDPGTSLQSLAEKRSFRRVFPGPADVGGRYSALSYFGLVPAALLGVDIGAMLSGALEMARRCGPGVEAARNPGLHLGALLSLAALRGREKLTFLADQGLEPLEDWIEQLIAESSGKKGRGLLPITVEPISAVTRYRPDRIFAYLRRSGEHDELVRGLSRAGHPVAVLDVGEGEAGLGAEFFRWEVATAVACHRLGVSAFDQPDVQRAKDRTSELLKAYRRQGALPLPVALWEAEGVLLEGREGSLGDLAGANLPRVAQEVLERVTESDALVFLPYLPASPELEARFRDLRATLLDTCRIATSRGYGPRYLHSTGQIHKGGPDRMVFVLLTADRSHGVAVPGMGVTFNVLQRAQAIGDLQALLALGRRAFTFHLDSRDRLPDWFEAFHAASGRCSGGG